MTRYACTNYGCPTRAPVTAASPPTCYTCARPMAAVREVRPGWGESVLARAQSVIRASRSQGEVTASGGTGGGGGSGNAVAVGFTRKPTDEERATRTLPPMVARASALSEHTILIRADEIESTITIDHEPTVVDYGTGYGRSLSFDSRASLDTVALLNGLYHKRTPFAVECGALFKSSCVLIGSYTVRTAASGLVIVEIEFRAIGDAP